MMILGLLTGLMRTIKGWLRRGTAPGEKPRLIVYVDRGLKLSPDSSRWTMVHGHFFEMGGIGTIDPMFENSAERDPRGPVLTTERYKELTQTQSGAILNLKLRKISEEDIKDRSKADFLSKLIAIVQTTWFMLHCLARGQQRLALTELELVTLALASLNAVTYAFWWHKPLSVQEPMRIYIKTEEPLSPIVAVEADTSNVNPEISAYYIIFRAGGVLQGGATDILDFLRDPCKDGLCGAFLWLFIGIPFWLFILFSLCL